MPFKVKTLELRQGQVRFAGHWISLFDSYGLKGLAPGSLELRAGSFSEDARGRWYLNVSIEVPSHESYVGPPAPRAAGSVDDIGIDLGLKDLAACSDGRKEEARRFYRDLEPALAAAQRAGKKDRVKAIHAKIANRRKDALHKFSTALVKDHQRIFVGNVNASALAKTSMAKSVLDAGWSTLRTMLQYKCDDAGVWFEEVNEAYSTQTCSACGERTGPKGQAELHIRRWTCLACGEQHDRDVNAARNILLAGLAAVAARAAPGVAEQPAPCRPGRKTKVSKPAEARVSNEAGLCPAVAGHGPLAEGIPLQ
ncbi:RNA-guided endonuclease InsQ/TnpB family protein [Paucibacter soli]|uniref:RNA-guided endonuclease InsQ/TnpB family protein n=1 Tax=Paucibacter soli TaxID=3133433 RepID=UPI0030B7BB40